MVALAMWRKFHVTRYCRAAHTASAPVSRPPTTGLVAGRRGSPRSARSASSSCGSSSRSLPHAARTIVASDRNRRLVVNRLEERLVAPELLPHPARQMNPLLRQVLAQARPFPRLHDHRVDRLQPPEPVVSVRNAEASMRPSRRSSFVARLREANHHTDRWDFAAHDPLTWRRSGRNAGRVSACVVACFRVWGSIDFGTRHVCSSDAG